MAAKRALVVDDSKSARVVLSRMLEKYGIEVDTADSAETALEYLKGNRPDVVFMDHMMPGMDGLQAVRAIKADPDTATIPIMMYTSQEGELYVGQARALGVVGVLPKTLKPIDVTKVLYQLRLLPDRRDGRPSELQPVDAAPEAAAAGADAAPPAEAGAAAPVEAAAAPSEARVRQLVEALLKEQSIELRRFMVAALDSQAHRLASELKPREPEPAPEPEPVLAPPPPRPWAWIGVALAALIAVGVLGLQYWQTLTTLAEVEAARTRLEVETAALAATLKEARAAAAAAQQAAQPVAGTALPAREPPRPQSLRVPYGEPWLAGARLEALRTTVAQLERAGFRGTVQVELYAGQFCLADDGGNLDLAADDTPVARCAQVGNPAVEAQGGLERAPLAFANLAATVASRTGGEMQLALARGAERGQQAYPGQQASAGRWNEVAAANNRVDITVLPK